MVQQNQQPIDRFNIESEEKEGIHLCLTWIDIYTHSTKNRSVLLMDRSETTDDIRTTTSVMSRHTRTEPIHTERELKCDE